MKPNRDRPKTVLFLLPLLVFLFANCNFGFDGHGEIDLTDQCPDDPNKMTAGQCGCGKVDSDSDSDSVADCVDKCPANPDKVEPGECGCEKPEGSCTVVNQPPQASFLEPSTPVAPSKLGVRVQANDPDGTIARVQLWLDGTLVREDDTAPYEWGTANSSLPDPALLNLSTGSHELRAVAIDDAGAQTAVTLQVTIEADPVVSVDDVINAINGDRMREVVVEITSDAYAGRNTGTAGEAKARTYIVQHFSAAGLLPGMNQGYVQTYTGGGKTTGNVVGYLPASDSSAVKDEIVAVGAHHDHLGAGRPGANDNASGTAMVIELAHAVAKLKGSLKRKAVFITFSGEEKGCWGSNYYVKNDSEFPIKDTVLYINLDMVGLGKAGTSFSGLTEEKRFDPMRVYIDDPLSTYCTWDKDVFAWAGVKTLNRWYTGDDGCWHEACDTISRLNFEGMASRAKDVLQNFWNALQQ